MSSDRSKHDKSDYSEPIWEAWTGIDDDVVIKITIPQHLRRIGAISGIVALAILFTQSLPEDDWPWWAWLTNAATFAFFAWVIRLVDTQRK